MAEDYHFRQFTMRAQMVAAAERYVYQGLQPGDFLTAVICNNLCEAVGRADDDNLTNLPAIVGWFYNEAPSPCWGSKEKMDAWLQEAAVRTAQDHEESPRPDAGNP